MSEAEDGFRRVRVEHEIRIFDDSAMTMHTRHMYHVRCIRESRFFHRRYSWSGTGVESIPEVVTDRDDIGHQIQRLHGPVLNEGGKRRLCLVDLGQTYELGMKTEVEMRHRFIDTEQTFAPFFGHVAEEGLELLSLTVLLPSTFSDTVEARSRPARSDRPTRNYDLIRDHVVDNRIKFDSFKLIQKDPAVGWDYSITWKKKCSV